MRLWLVLACSSFLLNSTSALASPAVHKAATASGFAGHWESKNPYCDITLTQRNNKVVGQYETSPYTDGRRVQSGDIGGPISKPGHARVFISSSFAENDDKKGTVDLELLPNGKLTWHMIKAASETEDYAPDKVTLKRTK